MIKGTTIKKAGTNIVVGVRFFYQDNGDETFTFVAMAESLQRTAQNVDTSLFLTSEETSAGLADLRLFTMGDRVLGTHIGMEEQAYFIVTSTYTYDHSKPNWGSAEKDGDNVVLVTSSYNGQITVAHNKHVDSVARKSGIDRDCMLAKTFPLMILYVPHHGASWADCSKIFYYYPPVSPWTANFNPSEHQGAMTPAYWLPYRPVISVEGPTTCVAEEAITLTIKILDPETNLPLDDGITRDVYIESLSGYLNKQRVAVTGPSGTQIKFRALDLSPGDVSRLKLGWRNISGLVDHTISITS